jgi:ketosteroid isomerase-like protein
VTETESLVRRWFDAVDRHAIGEMAAMLAEEAVFDPPGAARIIGRETIKTALIGAAARERQGIADLVVMTDGGNRAAAEFTLRSEAVGDGSRRTEAAGCFFEVEDGLLARVTTYVRAS